MANYFELPVYKKALDLAKALTLSTQKTPRDIRFTRVTALKNAALDIAEKIAFANGSLDDAEARARYIGECIGTLRRMEIGVRVLKDCNHITKSGFGAIVAAEGRLGRQLQAWQDSTLKKIRSEENV